MDLGTPGEPEGAVVAVDAQLVARRHQPQQVRGHRVQLGHRPRPGYGPYALSKAGIAALTRQLALEMAPDVRVNCVSPTAVDTAFQRGGTGRSDEKAPDAIDYDAYARAVPLGRIAVPEDVTGPIFFLLSDQAAYITGQVLHVNGGAYTP